jgi:hypothetical protein
VSRKPGARLGLKVSVASSAAKCPQGCAAVQRSRPDASGLRAARRPSSPAASLLVSLVARSALRQCLRPYGLNLPPAARERAPASGARGHRWGVGRLAKRCSLLGMRNRNPCLWFAYQTVSNFHSQAADYPGRRRQHLCFGVAMKIYSTDFGNPQPGPAQSPITLTSRQGG